MKLFSNIPIPKSNHPIDYHSQIMAFGSCFAENMGEKFHYYKFQSTTNPFGILFHPLAIEKLISFALSEKTFTPKDVLFHNERWHCFNAHSQMSHPDKEVLLQNLNEALQITKQNLTKASHCIITLGTAWVYKHIESNQIVANCHKVPQKQFEKQLLLVSEIEKSLESIVKNIQEVNPNITFIFTISPVRHLKDGFVENQQSKAHLIVALHSFLNKESLQKRDWGEYFSAYEIMMDELRDYRFYADDMIHPSQLAIDIIWQKFTEVYFTKATFEIMSEVKSIQNGLQHKPFNPSSEEHQKFLKQVNIKIKALQKKFQHIQF
tara:strand:- start:1744 stop:2706 length:963 start_codon:yes stop_codon:yes gene_type:complete